MELMHSSVTDGVILFFFFCQPLNWSCPPSPLFLDRCRGRTWTFFSFCPLIWVLEAPGMIFFGTQSHVLELGCSKQAVKDLSRVRQLEALEGVEGIREERRVLNMGRVASEQVDDGQLRSGEGRGNIHFGGLLGFKGTLEKKENKAAPSGRVVGAGV
ncbi:uncharacterized [Tachysurus ichikawai]